MLSTDDDDTPPEELLYSIEEPGSGIVALKASPDDALDSFTQAQINNGEVLFIHQGGFIFPFLSSARLIPDQTGKKI